MNHFKKTLVISVILGLEGCSFGASMPQQVTSFNTGCDADTVIITDEVVDLNGEESWTAQCGDKMYSCTYLPESGSDCYALQE